MKEAAWQIKQMIGHRSDILKALAQMRGRFFILAYNEMTTDPPENRGWLPHFFHNVRGRGGGGLFTFEGEESAFNNFSFVVHELAHSIHENALNQLIDQTFDNRLKAVYNAAMEKGLCQEPTLRRIGLNIGQKGWAHGFTIALLLMLILSRHEML